MQEPLIPYSITVLVVPLVLCAVYYMGYRWLVATVQPKQSGRRMLVFLLCYAAGTFWYIVGLIRLIVWIGQEYGR